MHVLHLEYYVNVMDMLSRQFQLSACGDDFLKDDYCWPAPFMIFHKVGAGEIDLVQHLEIMHVSYAMDITVKYFITVIYGLILNVRT